MDSMVSDSEIVAVARAAESEPVRLLDRGLTRCAWIVGPVDGVATLCCGDRVSKGAYCATHHRLTHRPRPS